MVLIGIPFSAVALQQAAALQQTHASPADSVVVESPLPGGAAEVTRFLLNTVPPWVQKGGVVIVAIALVVALWLLVRRRRAIQGWLASRTSGVLWTLGAVAAVIVVALIGMGAATWNYTQHSNAFCTGCHVMNPAFEKFGNAENKHAELSCHACHQQSIAASARQVYLWVAERPEKIGAHAKVPNRVCESCHVTGDTAVWQRVAATAGHRVHLESDSSALRNVQCVTCHGVEVHRFKPVNQTCGQSGCHTASDTSIVLGKMATQTVRHCTSCHVFTADVPALATRDSARGTLVPGMPQCFGCHEMRKVLADFDERRDPHAGTCGMCHNPHTQKTPEAARASCTTAACHANWREEPFHVGDSHRRVGAQCLTCHEPHRARADASDCAGCHAGVRARGPLRPPMPFDTTEALRRASPTPPPKPPGATGSAAGHSTITATSRPIAAERPTPPSVIARTPRAGHRPRARSVSWHAVGFASATSAPAASHSFTGFSGDAGLFAQSEEPRDAHRASPRIPWPPPAAADTFSHSRHAKLACLTCHQTGSGHGRLTFVRPRGCALCHHQAPTPDRCATCHRPERYGTPKPVTVTVTVSGREAKPRPVDFLHEKHVSRPCTECHTTPVTLAPEPAKAECRDCHSEHHARGRTCTACHTIAEPKAAHTTLEIAHQRCDACHTPTIVARLVPTRSLCSTCHVAKAKGHYEPRECTTCHLLADPDVYRAKLGTPPS